MENDDENTHAPAVRDFLVRHVARMNAHVHLPAGSIVARTRSNTGARGALLRGAVRARDFDPRLALGACPDLDVSAVPVPYLGPPPPWPESDTAADVFEHVEQALKAAVGRAKRSRWSGVRYPRLTPSRASLVLRWAEVARRCSGSAWVLLRHRVEACVRDVELGRGAVSIAAVFSTYARDLEAPPVGMYERVIWMGASGWQRYVAAVRRVLDECAVRGVATEHEVLTAVSDVVGSPKRLRALRRAAARDADRARAFTLRSIEKGSWIWD